MNFIHLILGGSFDAFFQWAIHNGYFLIYIVMILEGPLITMAAAFAASLGVFNVSAILGLAVLGDITGDFIWFSLGYFSRKALMNKFDHFFGFSKEKMEKLKAFLERHPGKALIAIKLSPLLPVPGLIIAGSSHMSPKKFFLIISEIILPKSILFVIIGFFFGGIYDRIAKYINNGQIAVGIIVLLIIIVYFSFRKISKIISRRLEEEE